MSETQLKVYIHEYDKLIEKAIIFHSVKLFDYLSQEKAKYQEMLITLRLKKKILSNNIKIFKELNSSTKIETYISEVTQVILSLLQNAEDILLEKQINNPTINIKTYEEFIYNEAFINK